MRPALGGPWAFQRSSIGGGEHNDGSQTGDLHVSAYPPTDKTPLDMEDTILKGLVRQGLSLFSQVYYLLHTFSIYL